MITHFSPKTTTHTPVCGTTCQAHLQAQALHNEGLAQQIKDFFTNIFNTTDWPARWHCGSWTDFHGWLYILSDAAIWAAYFAIPVLLLRILNKRKDIPFPKILWLFIAFIWLCGITHLIDAVIFWWPAYRLSAVLRFATAIVSILTVFALYKILPMIYQLRTADQLEAEIEERKKAEHEARQQELLKLATEELMLKKDEFMSIASHELKTPITSVKASLQILEKMVKHNESLEPVAPFVEKASRQVNKLTSIIQELLDVTKIQAGKMDLFKTDFDLMEMVKECVDECMPADKSHPVVVDGDENIIVNADRNRIEQVLNNFLTNAFKYSSPQQQVSVTFERLKNGSVRLSVIDRGIGIPEDQTQHIFDRFYRVENTSQRFSGIGLGLYISAQIIARHNGEIGVNSKQGEGSTFWFII